MRLLSAILLLGACQSGSIDGVNGQECGTGQPPTLRVPDLDPGNDPDAPWPGEQILSAAFETPPYLVLVAQDIVSLRWRSAKPLAAEVRVSAGGAAGETVALPSTIRHEVLLTDLVPGAAYGYEVRMGGAMRAGSFVAAGGAAVRALHIAEFHAPSSSPEAAAFGPVVREFRPHLLIESGDMVDDGADLTQWIDYLRSSAAWISNAILLPAHSNHVSSPEAVAHMRCLFLLPEDRMYFTTRFGPLEVLSIASEHSELHEEQRDWIRARAEDAHDGDDDPAFLLAAWHHPACSSNYLGRASTRERIIEDAVAELMGGGGVDLILVGHDKYYERSTIEGGIPHVMTNIGKVSPDKSGDNHPLCSTEATDLDDNSVLLIEADASRIAARAVRSDGSLIDEFEIVR